MAEQAGTAEGSIRLTVDVVVFTVSGGALEVMLVRRGVPPFRDAWALPGGFVGGAESLEEAAARALAEETGMRDAFLEQLYTFGDPGRDPRGRVVSVAYYALVPPARGERARGRGAAWWRVEAPPLPLAFDHERIVQAAVARLRGKLDYAPVGFELLPERFTLPELQAVHEAILGRSLDTRNFRARMDGHPGLEALQEWRRPPVGRPARLYRRSAAP